MFLVFMFLSNITSTNNESFLVMYNSTLNIKNKFFNFFLINYIFNFFYNMRNVNIFVKNSFQKKIKKINNYKSLFFLKKRSLSVKFLFNKLFKVNIFKKSFKNLLLQQISKPNINRKNNSNLLFKN